uniref:Uncharacterized protein n=1 Tax=Romanomermis culicivorax TaxID=13658 RepID=A0A915L3Q7_ROMCU
MAKTAKFNFKSTNLLINVNAVQSTETHITVPPFRRSNFDAAAWAPASTALGHLGARAGADRFGAKLTQCNAQSCTQQEAKCKLGELSISDDKEFQTLI